MARKRKKFTADFETTTDPEDCRVWAYACMDIYNHDDYLTGNDIEEFMQWCQVINADVYFHNLRFDGEFIVNWLLKHGFKHDKSGKERTFSTLISKMGQWYSIDICYGFRGKQKIHTQLFDSLKKLPFPVATVAKAFNLPIEKGHIDYNLYRPVGWEITDEEAKYIKNDVWIMAMALRRQFEQGLTKMTNGSDALTGFKNSLDKNQFKRFFPKMSVAMDTDIRKAYRGGFTWVNDRIQGQDLGEGIVFDVNSLYPSVMYDRMLPWGLPEYFKGEYVKDDEYPLYIIHIQCSFEIKENHIPMIQLKKTSRFRDTEYLKSSDFEIVDLYLTNVDYELFREHYNVFDLSFLEGWKFKQVRGLFKEYIDYWTAIKVANSAGHGDPALRQLAKLMLNSLYGKFASNPDVTGKVPYIKEDGSTGYMTGEEEVRDPVYTPMGIFITSYARELTISTAQKVYDRICYCDTDSIHLTGTDVPKEIEHIVDDSKLGYWAHESTFQRARFIRQKTYCEEVNGVLDVKCAGMPETIKTQGEDRQKEIDEQREAEGLPKVNYVTWDNFHEGFSSFGKLVPKHVNGGVVLKDTEFTIKEMKVK